MSDIARNHHYIPQFYLRGFLDPNLPKEGLHVIDKIEGMSFTTSPRRVGFQRDFNRVDIPGKPIDELEKLLAGIDGETARVLKYVEKNKTLPKDTDMGILIDFVSSLRGRNPQIRNNMANATTEIIKQMVTSLVSSREEYESRMQQVYGEGAVVTEYEDMKRFVEEDRYHINLRGHHLKYESDAIRDVILPHLSQRKWSLLIAEEDTSDFVCSDRPALLVCTNPPDNPYHPDTCPGLGMRNTELTMPLNHRMALVTNFENRSYIGAVGDRTVAVINARMIHSPARWIYCSNLDFKFLDNGEVKSGGDLVD